MAGLLAAQRTDQSSLQIAASLWHALPLRSVGRLAEWRERLTHYPEELQRRVIERNTVAWSDPHTPLVRWAPAARGALMPLAMRLL